MSLFEVEVFFFFFQQKVPSVSLPFGSILAVADCVFGNCSWSGLYSLCLFLWSCWDLFWPAHFSILLVCYFGSLSSVCSATACFSELFSWSSVLQPVLQRSYEIAGHRRDFGARVRLVTCRVWSIGWRCWNILPAESLPAGWLEKLERWSCIDTRSVVKEGSRGAGVMVVGW